MSNAAKTKLNRNTVPAFVMVSGLAFAVLSPLIFHLAGWQRDGWLIVLLATGYFLVAQHAKLVLKPAVILFHYGILLITLGGFWEVLTSRIPGIGGSAERVSALILQEWGSPGNIPYALSFLGAALAIFLTIYSLGQKFLARHGFGASWECCLFIYSILLIPCDFVVADVVAQAGAERPLEVVDMITASFVSSLALSVSFHLLVVSTLVYRHSAGLLPSSHA